MTVRTLLNELYCIAVMSSRVKLLIQINAKIVAFKVRISTMARGVYLIGSKVAQCVQAVQVVDCAGNSTMLRLKDYLSRRIQPEYKVLPWQEDVALGSAYEISKSM